MTDVDQDGYVDLIIGGSYQNEATHPHLEGPSIFGEMILESFL